MKSSKNTQSSASMSFKERFLQGKPPRALLLLSGLLLIAALLVLIGYILLFPRQRSSQLPLVLIHSPENGAELVLGEAVQIHATARYAEGINRIEFWVDDNLEDVEISSLEEGLNPFPMLVNWIPDREGEFQLTFRAFNSRGARSQSFITVVGIPGSDRDRDGVENKDDACPDLFGAGEDGCPPAGDGDGDGVADGEDLCPEAPGEADDLGCPDRDGDGVPDYLDANPDEPGPAELDGAPDSDGDTVPDLEDLSPDEAGDPGSGGAPDTGAGDRDGDGAPDDVDPCPDDPGLPEDGYCPVPGDDDRPEEGVFGEAEPGGAEEVALLEVEAYSFRVGNDYDDIWCYVKVGPLPMEQYDFQPEGDREWNIREVLAGANSVHLGLDPNQELSVYLSCMGTGAEDGLLHELGEYEFNHPQSDWNGRELVGGGRGDDGDSFLARYRICSPICDETVGQAPILDPITLGPRGEGPYQVRWHWEGDEDWLSGFLLAVNHTAVAQIPSNARSMDLADYVPRCGELFEFQLYAVHQDPTGEISEISAPSNTRIWDGETCPRTIQVSFLRLDPSERGDSPGPVYGSFFANDQRLQAEYHEGQSSFNATDDPEWYLDRIISIPYMFEEIERVAWSCIGNNCTTNYAPSTNALSVELGPRESLTFGASIWTERDGNLFEGFESIPAGEIVPGEYHVRDSGIDLTIGIDVLIGPEAGGPDNLPDLVVTGVDREEESGQLRIHVFNNAADLVEEDIPVSIVRMSTGEELFLHTWENVTIPSGDERILMSQNVVLDSPYDLRIMVDPVDPAGDGGIRETDELNNIYETPVLMRVQINGFRVWQPCESFLDLSQSAEFRFRVWVSHRSPEGQVTLVREIEHPWVGTLDYYWGEEEGSEHIGEWDLQDNPGFEFEFEMPADHTLTIHADGYEDDAGDSTDDYAGWISESYGRDLNYGDSDGQYEIVGQGWHECHDGTPLGWDENTFLMRYSITRVH